MRVRVTVFAGSSLGSRPEFAAAAADLGRVLAEAGVGIVYGGSSVGLMGILADAAMAAGGEVIGVIPQVLVDAEVAARGITRLEVVATMHQRKARMADLCDAFAALPGGLGTLEELFEILTWRKLGLHDKPTAVLNVVYTIEIFHWLSEQSLCCPRQYSVRPLSIEVRRSTRVSCYYLSLACSL